MPSLVRGLVSVLKSIKWAKALETTVFVSTIICEVGTILEKHNLVKSGTKKGN